MYARERRRNSSLGLANIGVVTTIFLIGAINLGLGFGLALLLEHPRQISIPHLSRGRFPGWWPPWRRRAAKLRLSAKNVPQDSRTLPLRDSEPGPSFLEAQLWIARLALLEFRQRLRKLDQTDLASPPGLVTDEFRSIREAVRSQLAAWQMAIQAGPECDRDREPLDRLRQQLQQLSSTLSQDFEALAHDLTPADQADAFASARIHSHRLFRQLGLLLEWCDDSLARLLRTEERLDQLPPPSPVGAGPAEPYRHEAELRIQEWLAGDPERIRIASALLVDVDRCEQLNDRHGLATTDAVLGSLRQLLKDVIRKGRGFDRLAALGGQTYLIFMGDTALRNATTGTERIRQNVAAAAFKSRGEAIPVTGSFSVTEWQSTETFDDLLTRLRCGLSVAKQAGGNCTAVCGPDEIRIARSTPMPVPTREIEIESSGTVTR